MHGDEEVQSNKIAVRNRAGENLGAMTVETLIARLKEELSLKV